MYVCLVFTNRYVYAWSPNSFSSRVNIEFKHMSWRPDTLCMPWSNSGQTPYRCSVLLRNNPILYSHTWLSSTVHLVPVEVPLGRGEAFLVVPETRTLVYLSPNWIPGQDTFTLAPDNTLWKSVVLQQLKWMARFWVGLVWRWLPFCHDIWGVLNGPDRHLPSSWT